MFITGALKKGTVPLKEISVTRNRIEVKAAEIGEVVKSCPKLESLTIYRNGIREEGMTPLLEACIAAPNLKCLNVSENFITDSSIPRLCELIEKSTALEELNIADCAITQDDNKLIIDCFKKSQNKWKSVSYDYNELESDELAVSFFDAITIPKTLTFASLKGNDITEEAQNSILQKAEELDIKAKILFESEDEESDDDELLERDVRLTLQLVKEYAEKEI